MPDRSVAGPYSELSVSLAERIRAVDTKSPAELAMLAAEVKDAMEDLSDVEPEIREMLLRRQRAIAIQDSPPPPRTPEPVEQSEKPTRVLRHCCCGCGAMLVCSNSEDAAMTEFCKRQLVNSDPPPPVNASAQRAYSKRLSKPRKPAEATKDEAPPPRPSRRPDYRYLEEIAKPREPPPPPPPEPQFRALPPPSFTKASKRPSAMKSSASAPDLFRPSSSEFWLPSVSDGASSKLTDLAELRCHVIKANYARSPAANYGLPLLPLLGEDYGERPNEVRRHVSASAQRRYTDEHLYHKPAHGAPGSIADLQARLQALKKENRGNQIFQAEDSACERTKRCHRKNPSRGIAPEIC